MLVSRRAKGPLLPDWFNSKLLIILNSLDTKLLTDCLFNGCNAGSEVAYRANVANHQRIEELLYVVFPLHPDPR